MATLDATNPALPVALDPLLSWPQLRAVIGLSRPQIWKMREAGAFPQPVRLSPNRIAWRTSEVRAWLASRESA